MATTPVIADAPVETTEPTPQPTKQNGQKTAPAKSPARRKTASTKSKTAASKTKTATATPKTAKPKAPKVYVFGGSVAEPEMGANSRRLWLHMQENGVSKKNLRLIKRETIERAVAQKDRFARWQFMVEACSTHGITLKDGTAINDSLVKKLQVADADGKIGRNAAIKLTV